MRTGITTLPLDYKNNPFDFLGIDSIPNEPRIPLENYPLDLVAESDVKESSIYLKGVERYIQQIWNEIVRSNWRTLRVRSFIPEKLGISSIYPYKNGRKAISIQNLYRLLILWKKYCGKSTEELEKKWNEIYKSNLSFSVHKGLQPTKLPKYLTPKLSYLIGFICGDGHLIDYGRHYLIKISEKSTAQLRYVLKPLFKELFNINVPIFHIYKGGYAIQAGNKPIFRFLTQVLKIRVSKVPEIIKNLDLINKKYFLMGVFDSEGNVDSTYLNSKIVISQANYQFLEEVMKLFRDLDIHFIGPYLHKTKLGTWYTIQVRRKAEILKYITEIRSCHLNKIPKLKILEQKLYAHGYCYNST